ncbi:hypothetical protein ACA910_008717 [Epithemia clementina (nom. ined.)]
MTLPADEKGMGFSKWRAESQDTTNNNYDSVNHSGTSSAAKALEETTGFGAFWCRCNDRLLAISAASEFQPQDWMYAEQLLQALASHHESTTPENAEQEMPSQSSFSSHVSIVTGAFELLDRLCDEVPQQLARQQREGKGEESPKSDQLSFSSLPSQSLHLPLSSRSLTSVLTIWQQCRRTCASEPPPSNVDAAPVAPLLEPMIVFDKINNYIQTGLFVANLDPYHVLLESVAAAGLVQERHKSLFQIVRYLLEQSKQDPEHPLYPTITTVELAMQGTEKGASPLDQHGILPRQQQLEMIQRTDVYMKLLQHGQQQTGREDFRVTPFIGVTALRALSRINPSIMDLNESGRRIGELVVRLIDQYCCSSTNAGTSENVDSIVCQLAQSARPKDGLPATAAWAILKEWLQRKSQNSSFARVGEDDISESTTTTAIGKPQQSTLLAVVSALTRSGHMEEAAQVVQHMTEHAWQNLSEIRTRRKQLLTLLWAYATVRDFQGAKTLLQDWNNIDTNELNTFLLDEIDSRTWDEVLSLCEEFGFRDALSQPVAFIIRLHRALLTGRGNVKSTERFLLNKFLTHCSQKSHANRAVDIAMELVQWMEQQTSHKINPDGSSYFNALLALKNSERIDRCTGYLRKLCDGVRSGKIKPKELDQRMFSMVITAQPKSAWTRARVVFDWMLEVGIHPGTLCYNSLISAIVHSDDDLHPEEKANLAVEIFAQMQPFGEGELSVKPDQSTFDLVLLGLSKSSNPEHLVNAQALLDEMKRRWIKPSRASYRALMLAWAKLGNPDKAEQVFQSLKNSYILGEINEKPGYKEYAARLEFWSNAGIPEMTKAALQEMLKEYDAGSLETKPGLKDYSAVIEAWVRSDSPQALDKAESELREIDRLANDDPKVAEARPNVFCYTALIAGYAQANLIEKALLLLNELHEISASMNDDFGVKPSVTTYNAILSALPNARGKTNCENAEALWEQMRDYGIQLNVDTYHALFATFARRPGILVGNIEELFHDMKQQYENGKKMLKPPFEVYSIRLIAWFKARNPEMTEQVLNEMRSRDPIINARVGTPGSGVLEGDTESNTLIHVGSNTGCEPRSRAIDTRRIESRVQATKEHGSHVKRRTQTKVECKQ